MLVSKGIYNIHLIFTRDMHNTGFLILIKNFFIAFNLADKAIYKINVPWQFL
jgi:hypothetical protein